MTADATAIATSTTGPAEKDTATNHFGASYAYSVRNEGELIPLLFANVSWSPATAEEQKKDIDYVVHEGPYFSPITVEVKTENQKKRRISLEVLSSDRPTLKRGWIFFTESQYMLYYYPLCGDVILIPTRAFQEYARERLVEGRTVLAPNPIKACKHLKPRDLKFEQVQYISVSLVFEIQDVLEGIPGAVHLDTRSLGLAHENPSQAFAYPSSTVRTWPTPCNLEAFIRALKGGALDGVATEPSFQEMRSLLGWGIEEDFNKRANLHLVRSLPCAQGDVAMPENPA